MLVGLVFVCKFSDCEIKPEIEILPVNNLYSVRKRSCSDEQCKLEAAELLFM